jgi:hypothetical protein
MNHVQQWEGGKIGKPNRPGPPLGDTSLMFQGATAAEKAYLSSLKIESQRAVKARLEEARMKKYNDEVKSGNTFCMQGFEPFKFPGQTLCSYKQTHEIPELRSTVNDVLNSGRYWKFADPTQEMQGMGGNVHAVYNNNNSARCYKDGTERGKLPSMLLAKGKTQRDGPYLCAPDAPYAGACYMNDGGIGIWAVNDCMSFDEAFCSNEKDNKKTFNKATGACQ